MSSKGAVIKSANIKYLKDNRVIVETKPITGRICVRGYITLLGPKTFYKENSLSLKNLSINKDEIIKNLESEIEIIKLELSEYKNGEKDKAESSRLSSNHRKFIARYKYFFSRIKPWKEEKPDSNINLIV